VTIGHEIDRDHVGPQCDVGMGPRRLDQGFLHGIAGGVVDVDDPAMGMPAFASEMKRASLFVEGHAEIDQTPDRFGRMLDHEFDRLAPIEPGPGDHGIADVILEGVALVEHGGNPALRPRGRTAVKRALGQNETRHFSARTSAAVRPAAPEPIINTSCSVNSRIPARTAQVPSDGTGAASPHPLDRNPVRPPRYLFRNWPDIRRMTVAKPMPHPPSDKKGRTTTHREAKFHS
jgi:hypothetical protein